MKNLKQRIDEEIYSLYSRVYSIVCNDQITIKIMDLFNDYASNIADIVQTAGRTEIEDFLKEDKNG